MIQIICSDNNPLFLTKTYVAQLLVLIVAVTVPVAVAKWTLL